MVKSSDFVQDRQPFFALCAYQGIRPEHNKKEGGTEEERRSDKKCLRPVKILTNKIHMKQYIFILAIVFLVPLSAGAHGSMMDFGSAQYDMMQSIEGQALQNDQLHEEMEGLMDKMMSGNLTNEESGRLAQFMNQYPGPMSMMMNRVGMMNGNWSGSQNMMNGWGLTGVTTGTFFVWLSIVTLMVWLIVGVLAIILIWKKMGKK